MSTLKFKDSRFPLKPYESVLDCLLRNGVAIPYACKAGMCQACLVRAVDCEASEESRKWIKPELQARGFTLACQWVPDTDVAAVLPAVEDFALKARLLRLAPLNHRVLRVELELCDKTAKFTCLPGQYLTVTNPAGVSRAYSVANDLALDGTLELHIGSTQHGEFTRWLFEQAMAGDYVHLRGPAGDCHYLSVDDQAQPLLLAGSGTGLAPLYGILRDALRQGHLAPITLVHGARTAEHLYLVNELQALEAAHGNFRYLPCVIEPTSAPGITVGTVAQVLEQHTGSQGKPANPAQWRAFVCGHPELVHALRKQLYLMGLRAANIHCDAFTERMVVPDKTDS